MFLESCVQYESGVDVVTSGVLSYNNLASEMQYEHCLIFRGHCFVITGMHKKWE